MTSTKVTLAKMTLGKVILAGVASAALLTGCGLRGDLERPPPIFSDPPSEEAKRPVDAAAAYSVAEVDEKKTYLNSYGGEIPKPAPGEDVFEESMEEFSPG